MLTGNGEVRINRSNDGGAAAGDEILRLRRREGVLEKGLAKSVEKVLKVTEFGETEGKCEIVRVGRPTGRPMSDRPRVL